MKFLELYDNDHWFEPDEVKAILSKIYRNTDRLIPIEIAKDLPLIADFPDEEYEFVEEDTFSGTFSFNETTYTIIKFPGERDRYFRIIWVKPIGRFSGIYDLGITEVEPVEVTYIRWDEI